MNTKQAIAQIMSDADAKGVVLSSQEIAAKAAFLVEDARSAQRKRNEYNVLSSKNTGSRVMKPITTLNALTQPVLRDLVTLSCAEFLGEEFWMSLGSMSEKLVAKRVYNEIRGKLTRGMC